MKKSLLGRPRLDLDLKEIFKSVPRHGQVMAAAEELCCSDSYIHGRLKKANLTLRKVLDGEGPDE